jgi:putative transposase
VNRLRLKYPKLSIGYLSQLFGKTREGYYSVSQAVYEQRALLESKIVELVKNLREESPGIGAYKLYVILKSIYPDKMIGRDKFYYIMKKYHLMLPPERRRHTTNSNHNYRKYKNLIKEYVPAAPNRLWVADITYIDTDEGVCYLHLITDAYTHEIIGWELSDSLMAVYTLKALEQAISQAGNDTMNQLIHHSDRGSQYCCNLYVETLSSIGARISMTEDYKPTDNAIAERVNGIIKQEWLYRMKRPENTLQARGLLRKIISFYNNKRPHMSNGMMTPVEKRCAYERWRDSLEASRLQP